MTANVANKYGYDITKPILNTTELKEINKSIKPLLLNIKIVVLFYKIPFLIRKNILNLKSLFFDKKYKK